MNLSVDIGTLIALFGIAFLPAIVAFFAGTGVFRYVPAVIGLLTYLLFVGATASNDPSKFFPEVAAIAYSTWFFVMLAIRWCRERAIVIALSLAPYFLYLLPVLVTRETYKATPPSIFLGVALFITCWVSVLTYAVDVAAAFYRFRLPRVLTLFTERPDDREPVDGWVVVVLMFASYAMTVYSFGIGYIFLSGFDKKAFSTGQTLSFIDGMYFSAITAATVGYGDIFPKSDIAKILVMIEVAISLVYVVLLFSFASAYARDLSSRRPKDEKRDDPSPSN
jgi:voltage-gated potassium channel